MEPKLGLIYHSFLENVSGYYWTAQIDLRLFCQPEGCRAVPFKFDLSESKDDQSQKLKTQFEITYPEPGFIEVRATQDLKLPKLRKWLGRKALQDLPQAGRYWGNPLEWFDKTLDR